MVLVPVGDPRSLAVTISFLAKSPDWRRKMGRASRLIALREFDERRVVDRVAEEYWRLLEAKKRLKYGTGSAQML